MDKNRTDCGGVSPTMKRHARSRLLGLILVGVAALAVACTPGGSGPSSPPANATGAPAGGSVAPPSASPNPSNAGKYGY
jgi:hypothetical protein